MRKMKESGIEWIGEIPEDWEVTILSALFKERKRKNIGLEETTLLSLSYGHIVEKNIDSNEGLLPASFETYNVIDAGCIVLRLTDLQNDKRSLRTGLCQERGIITSAYVTLERRQADNSPYMYYLFHTYDMCKVFYGMGDGVRQSMGYEELKRLYVLRPPFEQQKRIADYLDTKTVAIDDAIAKEQTLIDKLVAYKQSLITETVTKGLNSDAPMKDSGVEWIGKMPTHWESTTIVRIANVVRGASPRPAGDLRFFDGNDIPWITVAEVTNGDGNYIVKTSSYLTMEGAKQSRFVPEGTLLLSNSGATLGVPKITHIGGCINDGSVAFFDLTVNQLFLLYFLKSLTFELRKQMKGYGQPNLNTTIIKNIAVVLPPLSEQQQIADYLDTKCAAIDADIAKRRTMIEKLTQYKKSLIYEAVTGKIEI